MRAGGGDAPRRNTSPPPRLLTHSAGRLPATADAVAGAVQLLLRCDVAATMAVSAAEPATCAAAAGVIAGLATGDGMANFRFAGTCNVAAGCPFSPSSFADASVHRGFSLGLQHAPVLVNAVRAAGAGCDVQSVVAAAQQAVLDRLAAHVAELRPGEADSGVHRFLGVDTSLAPAPMASHPLTALYEAQGVRGPGAAGGIAASARLTAALQSARGVPLIGYCGLMLPVCEDSGLAEQNAAGHLRLCDLLACSAVCGVGLDTVPLPGDTPVATLTALVADVAAMSAVRPGWGGGTGGGKQLSARLFPIPGKAAGERTSFSSPFLVDSTVMAP